jgi:hypothetical protein
MPRPKDGYATAEHRFEVNNHRTRQSILDELPGIRVIDRSSMNAWEDEPFREAVRKTGRKQLISGALYTEICLAFPVVEALKDGYEVTFVVDAVGGLSQLAHRTAIERVAAPPIISHQAGIPARRAGMPGLSRRPPRCPAGAPGRSYRVPSAGHYRAGERDRCRRARAHRRS